MKKLAIVFAFLAACVDESVPIDVPPDVMPISIVYPCNTQYETCAAAKIDAEAVCERAHACDSMYDVPMTQCVASVMNNLCSSATCNSSPYDSTQLNSCLESYRSAACDVELPLCQL